MDWEEYITNLWTERLVWVRQLILSIMLNLRDVNFVAQRVQRNDVELGQILESVYGVEAGREFERLLGEYIRILSEVASTIKAGGKTDILEQRWREFIEEISDFLSQLNPYWQKSAVESLISDERDLEFNFASELKKEQYEQAISNFDVAYDKARQAARLMIYGLKMQLGL